MIETKDWKRVAGNVGAFVLLGISYSHPRRQLLNVVTKDKILFCCSIVNVKLEQKAEQRTER